MKDNAGVCRKPCYDSRSMNGQRKRKSRRPMVVESSHLVSLLFDTRGVQSSMFTHDSCALAVGYTRTMMGFLLFQPRPRRISMIGLGGGSLVKYCYHHLPETIIAAIEINPEVIALRQRFHIPPDDERLEVICADGADYVTLPGHRPDVLLVDGFDADGLPADLGSRKFYAACHRRLGDDGVLVANLMSNDPGFRNCVRSLRDVFGDALALAPAEDSVDNVIVFAWKRLNPRPPLDVMVARAHALEAAHALNLRETAVRIEYGRRFDWDGQTLRAMQLRQL